MFHTPRLLRLISSVALSASIAFSPLAFESHFQGVTLSTAEAAQARAGTKLTASQLIMKMEQALVYISQRLKTRPAKERVRSAPLVKSLVETSQQLRAIKKAVAKKNNKALARALPAMSSSVARLENAYRLSGIKGKDVALGVTSLKSLWRDYLTRTQGNKTGASKTKAVANARRIAAMRRQIAALTAKRHKDARDRYEFAEMQRRLDLAEAANRSLTNQWLATILLAEALGIYTGYYDYVVVYHPADVVFYRDSYTYFSAEVYHSYDDYDGYYSGYTWSSYDQPVLVRDRYDFGMNRREYTRFESSYTKVYERYETVTETTIVNRTEITQINEATQTVRKSAATVTSAAAVPDVQADTVTVVDDTAKPVDMLQSKELDTPVPPPVALEEDTTAVAPTTPEPEATPTAQTDGATPAADGTAPAADGTTPGVTAEPTAPAADGTTPVQDGAVPAGGTDAQVTNPTPNAAAEPDPAPAEEPAAAPAQAEEPAAEPAPAEEPAAEPAPAEEPAAEPAPAEEPAAEPAPAEEPAAEPAPVEEPQAEAPVEEQQPEAAPVEEPAAEEPQVEPAPVEEPQVEEPQVDEPQPEAAPVEEQPMEEPQVEEPPVEEPQAEPAPVEEPQAEPAQVEEPQPEPEPQQEPEPQAEPEPQPEPEPQAEPEPAVEQAPVEEPQAEQAPVEEAPAEEAPACPEGEECPQ